MLRPVTGHFPVNSRHYTLHLHVNTLKAMHWNINWTLYVPSLQLNIAQYTIQTQEVGVCGSAVG